jgi:hypothetical protein
MGDERIHGQDEIHLPEQSSKLEDRGFSCKIVQMPTINRHFITDWSGSEKEDVKTEW